VLAVEKAPAGTAFNAASENPTMRQVAGAVGEAVGFEQGSQRSITPQEARREWGFFADPLAMDLRLSGEREEEVLGWDLRAPSIYEDL
jgi:nucleoside-diphosphate-sugar epimerase